MSKHRGKSGKGRPSGPGDRPPVRPAGDGSRPPAGEAGKRLGPAGKRRYGPWAAIGTLSLSVIAVLAIWPVEGPLRVLPLSLVDLVTLAGLLLTATALGSAILGWVGPCNLPRPLAVLLSAALGIGAYSIALLAGGLAGLIGGGLSAASPPSAGDLEQRLDQVGALGGWGRRWLFFALPAAGLAIGGGPLLRLLRRGGPGAGEQSAGTPWSLAAFVLVPTLIVVIAGANLTPGVLWEGNVPVPLPGHRYAEDAEGHGHDALQCHLQAPREFLDNGRISFLPHNVHASFPLNAEMWFMLLMGLTGRPHSAVFLVQWFNVLLAAMTVAGVYLAGRIGRSDSVGAVFAAVAVAATPMLATVGVVAGVEPMMLLFMAAALALIRHCQVVAEEQEGDRSYGNRTGYGACPPSGVPAAEGGGPGRCATGAQPGAAVLRTRISWDNPPSGLARCAVVVGLLLGLAAGASYLAVPMFILPLAVGLLATGGLTNLPGRRKLAHGLLAGVGLIVALSPWLARNVAQTASPFFPLMWGLFGGGGWTPADALRWDRAHLPHVALSERLGRAWWRFFSHPSLLNLAGRPADEATRGASLFGAWLYLLAWPVLLTRQRARWDWMLAITFAGQFGFWLLFTDQPGRSMLPAVIVLGLLVGRSLSAIPSTARGLAVVVLLSLAAVSGLQLSARLQDDTQRWAYSGQQDGQSPLHAAGTLFRDDFQARLPLTAGGQLNRWLAEHHAPHDRPGQCRAPFAVIRPVSGGNVVLTWAE
jgi:hypothetical protein